MGTICIKVLARYYWVNVKAKEFLNTFHDVLPINVAVGKNWARTLPGQMIDVNFIGTQCETHSKLNNCASQNSMC